MASSEAERLLRIARCDLRMARRLLEPDVEEASWGWALQQAFEKTLKAWLHHLEVTPPHSHDIARVLVLLEQAGVAVSELLPLRAFTTFAVQGRYDDEPEER
jgi:HEPN domain-containing protein